MVPIQTSLIDRSLLSSAEVAWINSYHNTVRDVLEPIIKDVFPEAHEYLILQTTAIDVMDRR